ncbi:MAG: hypothetical protein M1392_05745 [Gammaproteobacteria bacterium]|nr:hypothetical protein [Gammaproteobacteria bacterium]
MRHSQRCVFLPPPRRGLRKTLIALLGWLALGAPVRAEFILFPEFTLTNRQGLASESETDKDDIAPALDLFYTTEGKNWRLLGEFFVGEGEAEVERLQLGWFTGAGNIFWLGKHHAPLGYWNTRYHHGRYLQTSISRPGIVEYEEDGVQLVPLLNTGDPMLYEVFLQKVIFLSARNYERQVLSRVFRMGGRRLIPTAPSCLKPCAASRAG